MGNYKLIVLSDPLPGKDDEYNDWYTNLHLRDVVAVPGFVSAQRFQFKALTAGEFSNRYLAIYDIETDNPDRVLEDLQSRSGTDAMFISDAFDLDGVNVALFEQCSPAVFAPQQNAGAVA